MRKLSLRKLSLRNLSIIQKDILTVFILSLLSFFIAGQIGLTQTEQRGESQQAKQIINTQEIGRGEQEVQK